MTTEQNDVFEIVENAAKDAADRTNEGRPKDAPEIFRKAAIDISPPVIGITSDTIVFPTNLDDTRKLLGPNTPVYGIANLESPSSLPETTIETIMKNQNETEFGKLVLEYNNAKYQYIHDELEQALYTVSKLDEKFRNMQTSINGGRITKELVAILWSAVANLTGLVLTKMKEFKRAILNFDHSIEHFASPAALNNKGICFAEIEQYNKALEILEKAIELGRSHINLPVKNQGGRGIWYTDKEKEKEIALQELAKIILNKAFVYLLINKKQEAYESITKEFDELLKSSHLPLYSIQSNFDKWLESILNNFHLSSRDLYIVSLILRAKNQETNSLNILNKALESDTSNPYLWYQRGNISLKQQNYEEAVDYYTKVTESNQIWPKHIIIQQ